MKLLFYDIWSFEPVTNLPTKTFKRQLLTFFKKSIPSGKLHEHLKNTNNSFFKFKIDKVKPDECFFTKVGHKTLFLMREKFKKKKNRSINSIVLILFYFIFQNGNGPHFLVVVSVMCLLVLFFFLWSPPWNHEAVVGYRHELFLFLSWTKCHYKSKVGDCLQRYRCV
jgi:hypothetical protein